MKLYAERDEYRCVLLEPGDWEIFRAIELATDKEEGENRFSGKTVDNREYWQSELEYESFEYFCVLEGEKPVAIGELDLDPEPPHLTNDYVLEAFRGRRLSGMITQARLQYLLNETDCMSTESLILPANTSALRAAEKSGFRNTGRRFEGFLIYEYDLGQLRRDPTLDFRNPEV